MLDNRYALLFVRGERPVMDFKYNLLRHPHIAGTLDGGCEAYVHGQLPHAYDPELIGLPGNEGDCDVLSEEDVDLLIKKWIQNINNTKEEILND